jgi:hypothetical protein
VANANANSKQIRSTANALKQKQISPIRVQPLLGCLPAGRSGEQPFGHLLLQQLLLLLLPLLFWLLPLSPWLDFRSCRSFASTQRERKLAIVSRSCGLVSFRAHNAGAAR